MGHKEDKIALRQRKRYWKDGVRLNMACPWNNEKAIWLQQVPKVVLNRKDVIALAETEKPGKECRFASMEIA